MDGTDTAPVKRGCGRWLKPRNPGTDATPTKQRLALDQDRTYLCLASDKCPASDALGSLRSPLPLRWLGSKPLGFQLVSKKAPSSSCEGAFSFPGNGVPVATFPHLNPLVSVAGKLALYHCPDIETVDRHLANLATRIRSARFQSNLTEYWFDADLLLDRRSYLELATSRP